MWLLANQPLTCLCFCAVLRIQCASVFFSTSLMVALSELGHLAMQCSSLFAIEMSYVHYNIFMSSKRQCVKDQYS